MTIIFFSLVFLHLVDVADASTRQLVAYDPDNQLLSVDHDAIHVITDDIDHYRPKLHVRFVHSPNSLRRRTVVQLDDGKIKITNKTKFKVEKVKFESDFVELRFGGSHKVHYPYNRVITYSNPNEVLITSTEPPTTTTTTTTAEALLAGTISSWATPTTMMPNYSAIPALLLPSRFHKKKDGLIVVFKKT